MSSKDSSYIFLNQMVILTPIDIASDEVEQFMGEEFKKKNEKLTELYIKRLNELTNNCFIPYFFKTKSVNFYGDEIKFTISKANFFNSIIMNLNCRDVAFDKDNKINISVLRDKIEELGEIKDKEELKNKFPAMHDYYLTVLKNYSSGLSLLNAYDNLKKGSPQKKILLDYMKNDLKINNVDDYFRRVKLVNFKNYVYSLKKFLSIILDKKDKVVSWIKNNPMDIKLTKDENRKLILYLMYTSIRNLSALFDVEDVDIGSIQAEVITLESLMKIYESNFNDEEISLSFNVHGNDFQNSKVSDFEEHVNYSEVLEYYDLLVKDNPQLKFGSLDKMDDGLSKKKQKDYVLGVIRDLRESFNDVLENEFNEIVENVINNSSSSDISKVESLKRKIKFLLENKPISIIKGENTFDNYFGYVYQNGYVVFEYISENVDKCYGHAIYVIHVDDLKKYSNMALSLIKKEHKDKVHSFNHSSKWEKDLKNLLSSYADIADLKISSEIEKINMLGTLEQLESLKNSLPERNEKIKDAIKKREERIKKAKEYDLEIRSEECASELFPSESNELLNEEEMLLNESVEGDFVSFHEKQKSLEKKVKRNPAVSLETKLRTKDEMGFMHCDLCGFSDNDVLTRSRSTRMFESHHIIPISEGGIDNVYNTSCLCPSCHKRIHNYLRLKDKIGDIESMGSEFFDEFMTLSQYAYFINNVRNRVINSTPEYIEEFDSLFTTNNNEALLNFNFEREWNSFNR